MYVSDAFSSEAYRLWGQAAAARQTAAGQGSAQEATAARPADIWRSLGSGIDVHSATLDQLSLVSQGLYDNGQISLLDHATLSFDPAKGALGESADTYVTQTDGSGKRDWVAEFEARLTEHMEAGDSASAAVDQRVLGILHRLEAATSGGVNVTV